MSCFDAFLDSMYGPETPRKRMISHVDSSVESLDPTTNHKRPRIDPYQPPALQYIFTDREMNPGHVQKENKEREREQGYSPRFDDGSALKKALDLLMSPPTSTPPAMSDCRSSPSSSSSSTTPSPLASPRTIRRYKRPAGPVTHPTRTVPVLQLIEPDEIPEWLQLSKIFEEKAAAMMNYDLLLVPETPLPKAQPSFDIQASLNIHPPPQEYADSNYLSEFEALIEAYF